MKLSALLVLIFFAGCFGAKTQTFEVKTKVFEVNKKYSSLQGPEHKIKAFWDRTGDVYITRLAVKFEDENQKPVSDDFHCHSHLTILPKDLTQLDEYKLLTLSQGQTELLFPRGFGLKVSKEDEVYAEAQVLNFNRETPVKVQETFEIHWTDQPLKPLRNNTLVFYRPAEVVKDGQTLSVLPEQGVLAADSVTNIDDQQVTSHWMVFPGQETLTHDITSQLSLDQPIRVHSGIAHLHPFAQSFSLIRSKDNTELIRFEAKNLKDQIGIESIAPFSSQKGVMLEPGVKYHLKVIYDNSTQEPVDAMAEMHLFVR